MTLGPTAKRLLLFGAVVSLGWVVPGSARSVAGDGAPGDDLRSRLGGFVEHPVDSAGGEALRVPQEVAAFYRARGAAPAWFDADGTPSLEVAALLDMVKGATRDGLVPSDYHAEVLDRLAADSGSPDRAAALELLLTDAFLSLADHLAAGKLSPQSVDPAWAVKRKRSDTKKLLAAALKARTIKETLEGQGPTDARYRSLKSALEAYRALQEKGPFPPVAAGKPLKMNSRGERVVQLRQRLARENYPLVSPTWTRFDDNLESAVKLFQTLHGLEPNGVVGSSTLAELNVPIETRLRQIEINLERLRWAPRELGERYILVDTAAFSLQFYDGGQPTVSMRVIVGADKNRTPIFDARMKSVVINPSWAIPKKIATQELLPKLRANTVKKGRLKVYNLANGRMQELDARAIDWTRVESEKFPYLVEESNHAANPLGSIKFVFPNDFAVYLHGTPDKRLFARERRTLSHGCVRVEDPVALASAILRGSRWTETEIQGAIDEGTQVLLPIPEPVTVHLWYRTAWVDDDGRVQFRKDIYGWDDKTWNALGREKSVTWHGPILSPYAYPSATK